MFWMFLKTSLRTQARVEAEKIAREQAAKEMVLGLGDSLGSLDDVLDASSAESQMSPGSD